jgi:hypothetical protein
MSTMLPTFEVLPSVVYEHNILHRNKTSNKSQWTISLENEREVFVVGMNSQWFVMTACWSMYIVDGVVQYLGLAQDHSKPVFLSKFVDGTATGKWHGYPVDHQDKNFVLPTQVSKLWLDSKILSTSKISKIIRRQPCSP